MTPATVARRVVERAVELAASQARGELDAAPTIEMLLAHPSVADGIVCCTRLPGNRVVVLAAIAVGRTLLPVWERAFPGQPEPAAAIAAAGAWMAEPNDANAESAVLAADAVLRRSLRDWHGPHRPAKWVARVAAWVALAPKYGWPAVAALSGACEAVPADEVATAVAECLTAAASAEAEPGAAADGPRL